MLKPADLKKSIEAAQAKFEHATEELEQVQQQIATRLGKLLDEDDSLIEIADRKTQIDLYDKAVKRFTRDIGKLIGRQEMPTGDE